MNIIQIRQKIINKTNLTMNYTCKCCTREYKEKFNYDRHVGFCEFSHKSRKERENDVEVYDKTPSVQELFGFMKEMSIRMDKLEKENAKLRVFANLQKKKIDILEWLNEKSNCKPPMVFTDWINGLPLQEKLSSVFNFDLFTGIVKCLEKGVDNISIDDFDNLPIRAFSQKPNTLYIFDKQESIDSLPVARWTMISNKMFDKWLNYIGKKFVVEFKKWCDENKTEIDTNEAMKECYFDNFQKVLGGKMSDETRNLRLRQLIYGKIKQNMKNLVEFEFI